MTASTTAVNAGLASFIVALLPSHVMHEPHVVLSWGTSWDGDFGAQPTTNRQTAVRSLAGRILGSKAPQNYEEELTLPLFQFDLL